MAPTHGVARGAVAQARELGHEIGGDCRKGCREGLGRCGRDPSSSSDGPTTRHMCKRSGKDIDGVMVTIGGSAVRTNMCQQLFDREKQISKICGMVHRWGLEQTGTPVGTKI